MNYRWLKHFVYWFQKKTSRMIFLEKLKTYLKNNNRLGKVCNSNPKYSFMPKKFLELRKENCEMKSSSWNSKPARQFSPFFCKFTWWSLKSYETCSSLWNLIHNYWCKHRQNAYEIHFSSIKWLLVVFPNPIRS